VQLLFATKPKCIEYFLFLRWQWLYARLAR